MIYNNTISTLKEQGFVIFDADTSDESLLKIASLFGAVVPCAERNARGTGQRHLFKWGV
jgi:hypothetical protein